MIAQVALEETAGDLADVSPRERNVHKSDGDIYHRSFSFYHGEPGRWIVSILDYGDLVKQSCTKPG